VSNNEDLEIIEGNHPHNTTFFGLTRNRAKTTRAKEASLPPGTMGYGKWFYQIALFLIASSFMKYVDR